MDPRLPVHAHVQAGGRALAETGPVAGLDLFFLAFLVAGAWHGGTANFLIYGALQGLGASAAKIYENAIVAARGRKGLKEYMKSPGMRLRRSF